MERIAELHTMASWGNVDLGDRLNLLQFCVQEALSSDVVLDDVDRLAKEEEEDKAVLEKKLRDIRDEAEKEVKSLLKSVPTTTAAAMRKTKKDSTDKADPEGEGNSEKTADEYEQSRNRILAVAEKKRAKAFQQFFQKKDSAIDGAIIRPLGMDRYKRLYWRFPLDRDLCVQSTEQTSMNFPLLPVPAELMASSPHFLFDDDDEEAQHKSVKKSAADAAAAQTQTIWERYPSSTSPRL
ncbi:hypothetical protein STCU_11504 [Strigomonas culicis]|uniref:WHIM2 domain-containing protein n=1 Tax=Strigomonas culicis TaxID=28005 RepID=S9UNC6_9TRYP|nr:hypothetical protein STCU_11504 [Strigomonas culicis]|eukprot:EPY16166.1 hypothetical protein STCU_11504 [Strigomonas culicis]